MYGQSSSPDAQLPAGLCAGWFGGGMTVVIGCTKNLVRNGAICAPPSKNSLKELVCDDQGLKCPTEIPVAGGDCIINSGLVGVRSWRREVQCQDCSSFAS